MKKLLVGAALFCAAIFAFAYNPPFNGEDLYRLTNPDLLSSTSASGGPIFSVIPASITLNPSLLAWEQRTIVNLSYTGLIDASERNTSDSKYGQGFQVGLAIPTKLMVFSGTVQGVFSRLPGLDAGNSLVLHLGASKDVTERLLFGMNIYGGYYFDGTGGNDFTVGADLGALYQFDDMGFLKSPRLGVAILNMGKPLVNSNIKVLGINGTAENVSFPAIFTPSVSFAATLFEIQDFKGGFSADLSFPTFQNVAFATAFGFAYKDIVNLNIGWNVNLRELINKSIVNWPSVGLSFKFSITSATIAKASNDWEKSEIRPSLAWQNLNGGIQAISAGVTMDLGMRDTTPPEIILWDGEEE